MSTLYRYLKLIPKKFIVFFITLGILYSSVFVIQYYLPLMQKKLIDTAILERVVTNRYFYFILIAYASYFLFQYIFNLLLRLFTLRIEKELSISFFDKIISLSKSKILKRGTGYYYDCLVSDVGRSLAIFDISIFGFLFSSIQSIFIFMLIYKWSKAIALVFLLAFLISVIISVITAKLERMLWIDIRKNASKLSAFVIDAFGNNNVIKYLLASFKFKSIFRHKLVKTQRIEMKNVLLTTTSKNIQDVVSLSASLIVIIYSLSLLIKDEMTYGGMIAVISYFQILFNPIQNFNNVLSSFYCSDVAIKRVLNIFDNSNCDSTESENYTYQFGINILDIKKIVFKDITLKLNNNEILSNVNFEVSNGNSIGIVGLSGEGKTSLLKILLKDEVPTDGVILINNTKLNEIPNPLYFSRVNILSQDIEILNNDLEFNLTIGKEIIIDKQKINEEIKTSLALKVNEIKIIIESDMNIKNQLRQILNIKLKEEFIASFKMLNIIKELENSNMSDLATHYSFIKDLFSEPEKLTEILCDMIFKQNYILKEKYDDVFAKLDLTKLTAREFGENGAFISGGEKQKIILGRFLLNDDYDFYILDEPFTNMDSLTEKKMLMLLKNELAGKSGLIISHKFNILLNIVDEFIVLKEGKIDQRGTHKDLLEKEGLYKELFECFAVNNNHQNIDKIQPELK